MDTHRSGREPNLNSETLPLTPPVTRENGLDSGTKTLLACVAFSLAAHIGQAPNTLAALIGLLVIALGAAGKYRIGRRSRTWLLTLGGFLTILGVAVPTYDLFPHPSPVYFLVLAAVQLAAFGVVALSRNLNRIVAAIVCVVLLGATAAVGIFVLRETEGVGFDVYHLHRAAAQALAGGRSPYGDAVTVDDGSFEAEPGAVIVGYPYPPSMAVLYAPASWLTGEPRWTNLIAWLATLTTLMFLAVRSLDRFRLLVALLFASIPAWTFVVQAGWTEMVTLALIVGAGVSWTKLPTIAPASLGLAVASKQYFLVALPLLLFHPSIRGKRAMVVLFVAAATLIPFVILDPIHLWQSIVAFHVNTPPRTNSANLVGLLALAGIDWHPPVLIVVVVPALVAAWAALRSRRLSGFTAGLALTLGTFFMISSQAFSNYWFLIAGLCGLSAYLEDISHSRSAGSSHLQPEMPAPQAPPGDG